MPISISLQAAWAIVERRIIAPDAPAAQRVEAQVAFYMGVHAALTAQLQAAAAVDQGALDVLHILTDEVEDFFELFGMSTAVAN